MRPNAHRVVVGLVLLMVAALAPLVVAPTAYAATLQVTSGADSGPGTLRATVAAAAPGDTINFALSVTTVTLTTAEIALTKNLTIRGNGPTATTITRNGASPSFRIFSVASGVVATIDLVTIRNGHAGFGCGGGINISGTLTLTRSTVTANNAGNGGGICNLSGATANISLARVAGNSTFDNSSFGGGIRNEGQMTITDTEISNNTISAGNAALGGGMNNSGNLTLTRSLVRNNEVFGDNFGNGGGVRNDGAMAVTDSVVRDNDAVGFNSGSGGGILLFSGASTIDRSEITGNEATGFDVASNGGGLTVGASASVIVTNSTIAANTAETDAGGVLQIGNSTVSLRSTTVADNNSDGAAVVRNFNSGPLTLTDTVVSNPGSFANCSGSITDGGNDLVFGGRVGSCPGLTTDPVLGPLADNGGPTRTMALGSGSAAIDAGAGCPGVDQRNFARTVGNCDIGAFEAGASLADGADPVCSSGGSFAGPPRQQDVDVVDAGRGLVTITNPVATNGSVVVPYFLPATTATVKVAIVQTDPLINTPWSFDVTDQAGNTDTCTGTIAPPGVGSVSPTSLAFGSHAVGSPDGTQVVTLTNTGGTALTVTPVSVTGTHAGDFLPVSNTCTGPVDPAGSCEVGVQFSPGALGPRQATLVIAHNGAGSPHSIALTGTGLPASAFVVSDATPLSQPEGNPGDDQRVSFAVTLSSTPAAPVSVSYATQYGEATAGVDYVYREAKLTFAAGASGAALTQTVEVAFIEDTTAEAAESFYLRLYGQSPGTTIFDATGRAVIANDDAAPPSVAVSDATPSPVVEGNLAADNRTATFAIVLSGTPTAEVRVPYATNYGTATAGVDYVATTGTAVFAAGASGAGLTQTVVVGIVEDTTPEADETVLLQLYDVSGASVADAFGQATIANDDTAPPTVSIADAGVAEGNTAADNRQVSLTVSLSAAAAGPVTVQYATMGAYYDSTASSGVDYLAKTGTLTFAAGTTTQQITVDVVEDTALEAGEWFYVQIYSPTGAALAPVRYGKGTITNDD